jgi:hypothetical protein
MGNMVITYVAEQRILVMQCKEVKVNSFIEKLKSITCLEQTHRIQDKPNM